MPRAGVPSRDSLSCPPPSGLTGQGLLALLGLGDRGASLRQRLGAALHAHAPGLWPGGDDDAASFGSRLLALLQDEAGVAAYEAAAAAAEADLAPADRRLDLLAAARRRAVIALTEAAPDRASRLRGRDTPLALAEAAADAALWSEAALLLWRLAASPETVDEAALLAARHPPLAEALPALASRGHGGRAADTATERRRLLRLMGFAEDSPGALVPPAMSFAPRIEALGAERIAKLAPGWRETLAGLDDAACRALGDAIGAYERAVLAAEARETALREAALQETLDLVVVEAALAEMREAVARRDGAWRAIADLLATPR